MDQFPDLGNLAESGLTVSYFAMSYLPQLWELDGVCHPYYSTRFIYHLGAQLDQVLVMMKLWKSSQAA
jgi:hypothetical protein